MASGFLEFMSNLSERILKIFALLSVLFSFAGYILVLTYFSENGISPLSELQSLSQLSVVTGVIAALYFTSLYFLVIITPMCVSSMNHNEMIKVFEINISRSGLIKAFIKGLSRWFSIFALPLTLPVLIFLKLSWNESVGREVVIYLLSITATSIGVFIFSGWNQILDLKDKRIALKSYIKRTSIDQNEDVKNKIKTERDLRKKEEIRFGFSFLGKIYFWSLSMFLVSLYTTIYIVIILSPFLDELSALGQVAVALLVIFITTLSNISLVKREEDDYLTDLSLLDDSKSPQASFRIFLVVNSLLFLNAFFFTNSPYDISKKALRILGAGRVSSFSVTKDCDHFPDDIFLEDRSDKSKICITKNLRIIYETNKYYYIEALGPAGVKKSPLIFEKNKVIELGSPKFPKQRTTK